MARLASSQAALDDGELMERARAKAGGNAELAAKLGVDQTSTSRWGRVRPIPRKYRSTIEDYLVGAPAIALPQDSVYLGILHGLRAQLFHAIESIDRVIEKDATASRQRANPAPVARRTTPTR